MTTHYLQCFEQHDLALSYDDTDGAFAEIPRAQVPVELLQRPGYYTRTADEPAGVYPSAGGPVLFVGGRRRRLTPDKVQATISSVGETQRFSIGVAGEKLSLTYAQPPFTDDLDEPDFFRWLCASVAEPQFYRFYTLRPQ